MLANIREDGVLIQDGKNLESADGEIGCRLCQKYVVIILGRGNLC